MGGNSLDNSLLTLKNNMKVLSAYLLAVVGGNESPSNSDVATILESVGIKMSADESAQLDKLIADFAEKPLAEVMAAGHEKLAKCGCGGGGGGGAAAAGGDAPAAVEEKKKSSSSSDDGGGGGAMFEEDY